MKDIPIRSFSKEDSLLSPRFNIRSIATLSNGKPLIQPLHRHDFYYILALRKAAGVHVIDFASYDFCDHSIFFMRPGQIHQLSLAAGSEGYLIQFKADFFLHKEVIYPLLRKLSTACFYKLSPDLFEQTSTLLQSIDQEFQEQSLHYQDVISANLQIFFTKLIRYNIQASPQSTSPYQHEQLESLLELIETHIAQNKQVAQYAEMLHLSTYQINAITKSLLGKNCSTLINEHIILEAKRYLLGTSKQINQIAFQLGYEDPSYFIRFFKKQTGYSPQAFRSSLK